MLEFGKEVLLPVLPSYEALEEAAQRRKAVELSLGENTIEFQPYHFDPPKAGHLSVWGVVPAQKLHHQLHVELIFRTTGEHIEAVIVKR